jgi:adenylate cyclase
VILDQRLEQLASPGGVVVQDAVSETVPSRLPFAYESLGEHQLKGFEKPVRAFAATLEAGAQVPKPEGGVSSTGASERADHAQQRSGTLEIPEKPSVAVLPFANMNQDSDREYFSDCITEDITPELQRFRDLFVIARNSSFTYKGKSVKVQDLAPDHGVRYVVEGSVRSAGQRIRITAQLIDAETGHHIWAERYDRNLTDLFIVQDEITQTVAATVSGQVTSSAQSSAARKRPEDLDAYDHLLRGQGIVSDTVENNRRAHEEYRNALNIDPQSARGYAGLAMCELVVMVNHWETSDDRALNDGLRYAKKAVALDHNDSRSQFLLGYLLQTAGRMDEAKTHLERAITRNPNDADSLAGMGTYLHRRGDPESAIEHHIRAVRLNPYHPVWYLWHLGLAYYSARRYEQALETLREAISRHPTFMFPRRALAATLAQLGRTGEARAIVEQIIADQPDTCISQGDVYAIGRDAGSAAWSAHWVDGLRKAGLPK